MSTTLIVPIFNFDEDIYNSLINTGLNIVFYSDNSYNAQNNKNIFFEKFPNNFKIPENLSLPSERNMDKDTFVNLHRSYLNIICAFHCVNHNHFNTKYFLVFDFNTLSLFKNNKTIQRLITLFGDDGLHVPDNNKLILPGCYPKLTSEFDIYNNIYWRFCGKLFLGTKNTITNFYNLHLKYLYKFLNSKKILTWQVNFWAWLEINQKSFNFDWYSSDHTDLLLNFPSSLYNYSIIKTHYDSFKQLDTLFISPYRPMSSAFVKYNNSSYLNIRFVNYWIYDNGSYYYPEDENVIRTINVCADINNDDKLSTNFRFMINKNLQETNISSFSKGIEDIRLFVSNVDHKLHFIGCTLNYSYCDKIRTITGTYDPSTNICDDFKCIIPPSDTWCEKNWVHIPLNNNDDGFIYSWRPLKIGKLIQNKNQQLLQFQTVIELPTHPLLHNMKGSTCFVQYKDFYAGLVHSSEEHWPRQYFHRLVLLDKNSYNVSFVSKLFCFQKASVEFCIGMDINENNITFWISQMDRDPCYITIPTDYLIN